MKPHCLAGLILFSLSSLSTSLISCASSGKISKTIFENEGYPWHHTSAKVYYKYDNYYQTERTAFLNQLESPKLKMEYTLTIVLVKEIELYGTEIEKKELDNFYIVIDDRATNTPPFQNDYIIEQTEKLKKGKTVKSHLITIRLQKNIIEKMAKANRIQFQLTIKGYYPLTMTLDRSGVRTVKTFYNFIQ